jgi:acetylornithine deacetylase/succinyl-diaminopimelate desuccinylase-like protein
MAAKAYKTTPRDYDVWIAVVADEEVSGAGSDAFTRYFDENTDYKAAYCMIAEPTDQGTIEIGHRGNRFVKLTFRGQAAHASQEASYAASATPTAVAFLTALPAVRKELHKKFAHDLMGEPSFTPTKVGHGEAFSLNKTTDIATVSVDIRTTPALDDAFDAWIKDLAVTYHFEWEYEAGYVPSALCDDDAAILTTALQSMNDAKTAISHGATDQAFFQRYGIQTIVFGPGDFALAHTCDESVSINRIKEVSALYTHILSQV